MRSWNHKSAWHNARRSPSRRAAHRFDRDGQLTRDKRFRRPAFDDPAQRNALDREAQLEHLVQLIGGEPGHIGAAIRLGADDALGLQQTQRLTHRDAANALHLADFLFEDALSGLKLAGGDHDRQLIRQLVW